MSSLTGGRAEAAWFSSIANSGAGDVVAAAGEQNRVGHAALAQQFFQAARELLELAAGVGHVLDRVALVGDRLDVVAVLVLEQPSTSCIG